MTEDKYEQIRVGLNALAEVAHENAKAKGFYDGVEVTPTAILSRLMLTTTELAEAAECVREADMTMRYEANGKPVGFGSEVADVDIRNADLCGWLGIPIGDVIVEKLRYNAKRPHKHGKVL